NHSSRCPPRDRRHRHPRPAVATSATTRGDAVFPSGRRIASDLSLDFLGLLVILVLSYLFVWSLHETTIVMPPQPGEASITPVELLRQVLFGTPIARWYLNSLVTAAGVALLAMQGNRIRMRGSAVVIH